MKMVSANFNGEWFLDKVDLWLEGPRFDLKREWKKITNTESKFYWAKHLIAFGNISYRTGKSCYILFGVDNDKRNILGVSARDFIKPDEPPRCASKPDASILALLEDGVNGPLVKEMHDWIAPEPPDISLEFGWIEDTEGSEKLVAYWVIDGTNSDEPFTLKIAEGKYKKRQPFIRKGGNTLPLDLSQIEKIKKPSEIAYLEKRHWDLLLNHFRGGDYLTAYDYPFFYPIKDISDGIEIEEKVKDFLIGNENILYLIGLPGSGKSLFLRRFTCWLSKQHESRLFDREYYGQFEGKFPDDNDEEFDYPVRDIGEELEVTPRLPIPIYISLRTDFEEASQFEKETELRISSIINPGKTFSLKSLFDIPGSKWVLLLDGLDELHNPEDRGAKLEAWLYRLPKNVKAIISSRPGYNTGQSGSIIRISALNQAEIIEQVHKLGVHRTDEIRNMEANNLKDHFPDLDELIDWLKDNSEEMSPILSNFRAANAFIKYFYGDIFEYRSETDLKQIKITEIEKFSTDHFINEKKVEQQGKNNVDSINEIPGSEFEIISNEDQEKGSAEEKVSVDFESNAWPEITNFSPTQVEELVANGNTDEVVEDSTSDLHLDNESDSNDVTSSNLFEVEEALLLKDISNELREENIRRKMLGYIAEDIDQQSKRELETFAWVSNWSTPSFLYHQETRRTNISDDSLKWNEILGFFERLNSYQYKFISRLFQFYAAAEYSCWLEEPIDLTSKPNSDKVIEFHQQLMKHMGKEPILKRS